MKRFPFRPVLIGIAAGAVLFFASFFLLRAALFVLIIGGLFRFFARPGRRGYQHHRHGSYQAWHGPYDDAGNSAAITLRRTHARDIAID